MCADLFVTSSDGRQSPYELDVADGCDLFAVSSLRSIPLLSIAFDINLAKCSFTPDKPDFSVRVGFRSEHGFFVHGNLGLPCCFRRVAENWYVRWRLSASSFFGAHSWST